MLEGSPRAVYPCADDDSGNKGDAKSNAELMEYDLPGILLEPLALFGVCRGSSSKESFLDEDGPEGEDEPASCGSWPDEEAREPSSRESLPGSCAESGAELRRKGIDMLELQLYTSSSHAAGERLIEV